MKISFSLLSLSSASHFRAVSLQYRPSATPGKMEVTRTLGFRRGLSGFYEDLYEDYFYYSSLDYGDNGCTQGHIDQQSQATMGMETITGIGRVGATYLVTNIEDSPLLDRRSHYCFGSYTFEIDVSKVNNFEHSFDDCCTITFTTDDGYLLNGDYGYIAYVNDVNNASPQFTSPPIWYIMEGCGGQTYHVNPVDPEADTVRCRWSTADESFNMAWSSNFTQFSLDEEDCIVTYHPERDLAGEGSKPVAIQVEDFDAAGNLLHSVPLAFAGVVFTPEIEASRAFQKKNPLYKGLLEGTDDHDDHHGRHRRSAEPEHCYGKPSFSGESPEQGSERYEIYEPGLKVEVNWEVSYSVGDETFYDIARYQFSRPNGMTCSSFDSNGKATCTWYPTAAQAEQGEHPHCAVVYDRFGRASDRQCVTLRVYPPCAEGEVREGSVCVCTSGYEEIDGICTDIDECARGIANCHPEKEICENSPGSFECICLPMSYEDAMLTIQEWIDMTTEVLEIADHGRAYKFDVRMHKLLRNALESYDVNCTIPYDSEKIGENDFAIWEKQANRSDDVCDQATTVKAGLNAWVDNYACMDKKNRRQTHRVSKFIEKVTNPYC